MKTMNGEIEDDPEGEEDPRESAAQQLYRLVQQWGPDEVQNILHKVAPDLVRPDDAPAYFEFNTAMSMRTKDGPEMATVVGLALISEQLNYIIGKLAT